jgi:hypothetical protein
MLESLTIHSDIPHLHRNSLPYLLLFCSHKSLHFLFNLYLFSIVVEYILVNFIQKNEDCAMLGNLLNVIWFVLQHMLEIWSLFW